MRGPGPLGLILVADAAEAKVGPLLSAPWFTCRTLTLLFFSTLSTSKRFPKLAKKPQNPTL